MEQDNFHELGVRILLKTDDDFLKIKETLTRIGIASNKEKKLYQSCCILHKRGQYAILHFKEMFILDGLNDDIPDDDIQRRNSIAKLLDEWGLCEIVNKDSIKNCVPVSQIKIIPFKEKNNWTLVSKYTVGK